MLLSTTRVLGLTPNQRKRVSLHRSHRICNVAIAAPTAIEFGCFTIIIDDIINPDGSSLMGALGGGGPQTLFGYQVATNQRGTVALAAAIGQDDFPEHCQAWLAQVGDGCLLASTTYVAHKGGLQ